MTDKKLQNLNEFVIDPDKSTAREKEFYKTLSIINSILISKTPQSSIIDDYYKLMQREQSLYVPKLAYKAGLKDYESGREYAFMDYIRGILHNPDNEKFLHIRDTMFCELCEILADMRQLMYDFNSLFRQCHGAVSRNIEFFYKVGYYTVEE